MTCFQGQNWTLYEKSRPCLCFRVHPLSPDEPQTTTGFKQAEGAEPLRAPPSAMHPADTGFPAGRPQPQSLQSCCQLCLQSCGLQGLQEQGTTNYQRMCKRTHQPYFTRQNLPICHFWLPWWQVLVLPYCALSDVFLYLYLLLQAVIYYTESLRSTYVHIQHGSCLALKCLRVSSTQTYRHNHQHHPNMNMCLPGDRKRGAHCRFMEIKGWRCAWRCQRDRPLLRYKLIFLFKHLNVVCFYDIFPVTGKKGYQAFQRMDQLYIEMEEEAYKNQETEITIL